ncbi:hypothetical protein [Microtetraspora malaysiensis]|uniref:hypothetical protein n=1 Tax=Microtetraspora malaysiensis TaxID=161358 RepID=UPI003D8E19D7
MRIRMLAKISGTRDGKDWPDVGGEIDLPDDEAAGLIAAGMARSAPDEDDQGEPVEEQATAPASAETATETATAKRSRKPSP